MLLLWLFQGLVPLFSLPFPPSLSQILKAPVPPHAAAPDQPRLPQARIAAGTHPQVAAAKDHRSCAEPPLALLPLPGGGVERSTVIPDLLVGWGQQRTRPVLVGPQTAEVVAFLLQGPAVMVRVGPLQGLAAEAVEAHIGPESQNTHRTKGKPREERGLSLIGMLLRLMVGRERGGAEKSPIEEP